MKKKTIISSINSEIKIIDQSPLNKEIFKTNLPDSENEFLLILKPEIFVNRDEEQLKDVLLYTFEKLENYHLNIENIRIQNASYLDKYNIIAGHYGVINAAARNVSKHITQEAKINFKGIYGLSFDKVTVYGALELIQNNKMDADTLAQLWKKVDIKRLAGGIYSGKTTYDNEELYIINGFHPPQLEHFIAENRMIITMNVSGNCDWSIARKDLIGNTYPEKAKADSIRGSMFNKYGNFGFDDVSYVINSVHLSAGPLEGLIELQRFNSSFEKNKKAAISDFSFGRMLFKNFTEKECDNIISNPTVQFEDKPVSLFDLTEEMNSMDAIEALKKVIK